MHPLLASTALGLVAAWPVGVLGLGLGRLVERLTDDPRPRAAAWSLAYALPAAALAATVALTFAPPSPAAIPGPARLAVAQTVVAIETPVAAAAPGWTPEAELAERLAWGLIGLSIAGLAARGWRWNRGRRRLAAIRAQSQPCQDAALLEAVRQRAARLGVTAPEVRISAEIAAPLLAGARRPTILLPKALVEMTDTGRLALVCGHELAHLQRRDNWRIPAEEGLAGLFWTVPPVAALRGRMLAAREAVCDRITLEGAAPEARRDYARALVEALRMNASPSIALSAFTGRDRGLVSMRLSAILRPGSGASAGRVGLAVVLGAALTAATGAGSLALAEQARRLAPPEVVAAAEEASAIAAEDAAPAAEAAPARSAAPAAPMAEAVAPLAAPAPAPAPAPMAALRAGMAPDPRPDPNPRPDPHPSPSPNPKPNPQPNRRVARDIEVNVDQEQARIEIRADQQEHAADKTVYQGAVTVRGRLNPALVNLKVNGRVAPSDFAPANLAADAIERLEVTPREMSADRKMTVNVVLKTTAR